MLRVPLVLFVITISAACGGGDSAPDPGTTAPDDNSDPAGFAGPPLPVLVDESGVPPTTTSRKIAFTNGTVVTLAAAGILENTTVVIEDGVITDILAHDQFVPTDDTEVIDASGRWITPGLVDAHVHLVSYEGSEKDLPLFLAAGVTGIRVMWGFERFLEWRDRVAAGEIIGPRMRVASPGFDGPNSFWPGAVTVTSEDSAKDAVQDATSRGYDAIKVYNGLAMTPYLAVTHEAEIAGIPVVGHVPVAVGADLALSDGRIRSIEHFSRFVTEVTGGSSWNAALDTTKALGVAEKLRINNTWNVPTMVVVSRTTAQVPGLAAHPAMDWVSEGMREFMQSASTQPPSTGTSLESRLRLMKLLHENGAPLAIGTDAGLRYVFPGFSIHEELAMFEAAGLSPEQILDIATRSAWELMGEAHQRGTIETGKDADLLLLAADPLTDVTHLNHRVGVMSAGRWYAQSWLMNRIDGR